MKRPEFLPDGHGRLIARRSRIIPGTGRLPPLRVDELRIAEAAANDDRTDYGLGLMILAPVLGTVICLVLIGFLLGKGA